MVFFWACEVTETKAAVVKIPESFVLNVCQATLASAATKGVLSVGVETAQMDGKPWKGVVAHLHADGNVHQAKLDLVVGGAASQVKFYVAAGTGKVNLTGYFQPGPPADLFEDQIEVAAAAAPAAEAPAVATQKSKKRAREEKKKAANVTWDQAASDSDSDEAKAAVKPAEPVKKQAKKEEPKKQNQPQPQAPQHQNGAADADKKKRKKSKNKNKKDN